jgi:hypothetical protein
MLLWFRRKNWTRAYPSSSLWMYPTSATPLAGHAQDDPKIFTLYFGQPRLVHVPLHGLFSFV